MKNKITLAISKIKKNPDPIKYGEEVLTIVKPYAKEFIDIYTKISADSATDERKLTMEDYSNDDKIIGDKISILPFFDWLNKQNGFKNVTKNLPIQIHMELKGIAVHGIANTIFFCADTIFLLPQTIVVLNEWKQLVDKHIEPLTLMSRNFELEEEEYLFLFLIRKLKNSPGSVYNSGKRHDHQIREFLTKRIIRNLLTHPWIKGQKNTAIADVALDIVGAFFDPMTRNRAISITKDVRKNVEKAAIFSQSTVAELLFNQNS